MPRIKATAEGRVGLGAKGSAKKPLTAEESARLVREIMQKYNIGRTDTEKKVEEKPKEVSKEEADKLNKEARKKLLEEALRKRREKK